MINFTASVTSCMVDFPALPRLVVLLVYFCIKIGMDVLSLTYESVICCSRFWCQTSLFFFSLDLHLVNSKEITLELVFFYM